MTKYHNSPNTGKLSRCRAEGACPFGLTHGTVIRKDGTVDVGTGSPSWSNLQQLPDEHNTQERIIVDENGVAKNIWHVENQPGRMAVKKPSTNAENNDEHTTPSKSHTILKGNSGVVEYRNTKFVHNFPKFTDDEQFQIDDGTEPFYHSTQESDYLLVDHVEIRSIVKHASAHIYEPEYLTDEELCRKLVFERSDNPLLFQLKNREEAEQEANAIASELTDEYTNEKWQNNIEEYYRQLRELDTKIRDIRQHPSTETAKEEQEATTQFHDLITEINETEDSRFLWSSGLSKDNVADVIMSYWESEQF